MARATLVLREKFTVPAVLYDNHAPKGHHRHVEGIERPYAFIDVARLLVDFIADVKHTTERGDA